MAKLFLFDYKMRKIIENSEICIVISTGKMPKAAPALAEAAFDNQTEFI